MAGELRVRLVVSGRVQGVFFRGATQEAARARGVDGWVRNLPDGRVEAVFEGAPPAVEALVEFCRHGPRGARVEAIGDLDQLGSSARAELDRLIEATAHCDRLRVTLALSYGGRAEIVEAARRIARAAAEGRLEPRALDEAAFSGFLYSPDLPDPDLLVRTSGEMRISNFLLWQIAYAELYVTETLWPDFGREAFFEAIEDYQSRERRFGRVMA